MVTKESLMRNVLNGTYAQALLNPKPGADRVNARRSGVVADANGAVTDPENAATTNVSSTASASTVRCLAVVVVVCFFFFVCAFFVRVDEEECGGGWVGVNLRCSGGGATFFRFVYQCHNGVVTDPGEHENCGVSGLCEH